METQGHTGRSRPHRHILLSAWAAFVLVLVALAAFSSPSQAATENSVAAMGHVQTAAEAMETYATDNRGSYRAATVKKLRAIEPSLKEARLSVKARTDNYMVSVRTGHKPNVLYRITRNANGTSSRTCLPRGRGDCPESGIWTPPAPPPPTPESIDAEAKSSAVTAAEAMETCATDNNGVYATVACTEANLLAIEPTLNDVAPRLVVTPGYDDYNIVVTSNRDSNQVAFTLSRASNGTTSRYCSYGSAPRGGCSVSSTW